MNLSFVLRILSAIPSTVVAVEQLAKGAKGSDKKTLAMQALGLAYSVGSGLAPEYQKQIDAAATLASAAIDNTVAIYNFSKHPDFVTAPAVFNQTLNTAAVVVDTVKHITDAPTPVSTDARETMQTR